MIEMHIAKTYGPIFWKTACLSVDAGIMGDVEKGTNYGATARALENFRDEILPPSLSKSDVSFSPDLANEKILFGLKPISGLNVKLSKQIIENRPYTSLEDFYQKNVVNGDLPENKVVTLIKSGLFDELNKDRRKIMIDYVKLLNPTKEKLTISVVPKIYDKIPKEFEIEKAFWSLYQLIRKNKTHNELEEMYMKLHHEHCKKLVTKKYPQDFKYDNEGNFVIVEQVFKKYYEKNIIKLKEWLKTDEALNSEAALRRQEYWKKHCMGSISEWEMESIGFYISKHELDDYPLDDFFNISNFKKLPEEPVIKGWRNGRGRKWPIYETHQIAGTVIDKDINKGIAILITQYGVVQVRIGKGRFKHYNKKVMVDVKGERVNIDDTWFKRGTKLVCIGYRRNNDFYCNAKDSGFQHSVMRINGVENGKILIQQEKRKISNY